MPGNKTPAINILGLTFYKTLCIRVLDVLLAFALLVLTTRPSDLIQSLVKRVIPQMMSQVGSIMDAQRSRGLETEGKSFLASNWPSGNELKLGALVPLARKRFFTKENLPL